MNPILKNSFYEIKRISNLEDRKRYLRLDKNECLDDNLCNLLSVAIKKKLDSVDFSIYPEIGYLRNKIAFHYNLQPEQIILGHGSDSLIQQAFTVYARPGSTISLLYPTYAMYEIYARMNSCNLNTVKCDNNFNFSFNEIYNTLNQDVSMLAIANPNSPTGRELSEKDLMLLLKRCEELGILMLLDEAYYYFSETTLLPFVSESKNLAVIRTFSKAFALAGCRIGFLAGHPSLVENIQKARPMYELNTLSSAAAETVIDFENEIRTYIAKIKEVKEFLTIELQKFDCLVFPSETNFVNIRLPNYMSSDGFEDYARNNGILLKGRLGGGAFHNCIRITLGPKQLMIEFINILKQYYKSLS